MQLQINVDTDSPRDARLFKAVVSALIPSLAVDAETPAPGFVAPVAAPATAVAPAATAPTVDAPAPALAASDGGAATKPKTRRARGTAAPAAVVEAPAVAPTPVAAAAPAAAPAPVAASGITLNQVATAFRKFYEAKSLPEAQKVLAQFSVQRVSNLVPDQYAAFLAAVAL